MNKKVLLVPIQDIINNSVIEQNVDQKILAQTLNMVQDVYLRPILTPSIFNSLIDSVYEFKVNSVELTDTYSGLLDAVKPYLIARTVSEFLIMNNYKISSKGVIKLSDNSGDVADENTVENLKNYYDNLSSRYKQMLLDYLDDNNLITEETDIDTTSDSVGWYLGDGENRIYNTNSGNSSTGTAGIDGVSGISGIQGYSGLDGVSGISGIQGSNGISGISGLQGTNGTSGISGSSGRSGISGVSGISGLSGVGISGVSGLIGISGLAGSGGSGTNNYLVKWSGTTGTVDSQIFDDGTGVIVGSTTNAGYKFDVNGKGRYTTSLDINTSASTTATFPLVVTSNTSSGYGIQLKHPSTYNTYIGFTPTGWIFANSSLNPCSLNATASAFDIITPQAATFTLRVGGTSALNVFTATSGITIFNPALSDKDFMVNGDTVPYLIYVDASADNVGIGTNTPNTSSIVDMTSTTKGFLPPRMTTTQRDAISSPAAGLMIYNTTTNKHQGYNGSTWNDFY